MDLNGELTDRAERDHQITFEEWMATHDLNPDDDPSLIMGG